MRLLAAWLFALLALACAPLALAAFAAVNPGAPGALRLLSAVEGTLAARAPLGGLDPFWRGLIYLALCAAFVWLAAYLGSRRTALPAPPEEPPRENAYERHGR